MTGIIALDMDGTSVIGSQPICNELSQYLSDLVSEGWDIVFVTGRTFAWSYNSLRRLRFPYHLIVQNGAITLRMPHKRVVAKHYLESPLYSQVEAICDDESTDFVLYLGYEYKDKVVYRPSHFPEELKEYLAKRCHTIDEKWHEVDSYSKVPTCASFKCFGERKSLEVICSRLEESLGLSVSTITDPINKDYSIVQATHPKGNKGDSLLEFAKRRQKRPIIAAGDDYNDVPMFNVADVSVVMATAPEELKARADIIAPPVEECGLVDGLEQAINQVES